MCFYCTTRAVCLSKRCQLRASEVCTMLLLWHACVNSVKASERGKFLAQQEPLEISDQTSRDCSAICILFATQACFQTGTSWPASEWSCKRKFVPLLVLLVEILQWNESTICLHTVLPKIHSRIATKSSQVCSKATYSTYLAFWVL